MIRVFSSWKPLVIEDAGCEFSTLDQAKSVLEYYLTEVVKLDIETARTVETYGS